MVLVLLFCTILIIVISLFFLIIFSMLKIEIKNFKISNLTTNKEKFTCANPNKYSKYEISIGLEILNKIKYFSLNLNSRKIKKITLKMHLDKTKIKELEREISISDIKEVMNIRPKISYMDLKLKLGIDDVLLTTYSVPIISTLISILLPYTVENKDVNNIKYEVKPIYNNGNIYDLQLNIGVKIKVIRILNAVYRIYKNKKNKSKKKMYKLSKIGTYYQ